MACQVRERPEPGVYPWPHEPAGFLGRRSRPGTPRGAPSPPLGARPGRRHAGSQPDTCPGRGLRSPARRRVPARHRLRSPSWSTACQPGLQKKARTSRTRHRLPGRRHARCSNSVAQQLRCLVLLRFACEIGDTINLRERRLRLQAEADLRERGACHAARSRGVVSGWNGLAGVGVLDLERNGLCQQATGDRHRIRADGHSGRVDGDRDGAVAVRTRHDGWLHRRVVPGSGYGHRHVVPGLSWHRRGRVGVGPLVTPYCPGSGGYTPKPSRWASVPLRYGRG